MLAVGLMSGTSLDGIDAALVRVLPCARSYRIDLLNFVTVPFENDMLVRLRAMLPPNGGTVAQVAAAHHALGEAFAQAAQRAAGQMPVDYVASHGQTVWHDGVAHVTLQLGDAFIIRERMHVSVCYDFRSADCAANGQGAPLVPYVDALLLLSDDEDRVAVNIGGIANLTVIPRGARADQVIAFDSGPGNMLIDAFVHARSNGSMRFDRNGELALRGAVDRDALQALLADPYFALPAPKSTGREHFGAHFLAAHDKVLGPLSIQDGAATLAAFTAQTLAAAVRDSAPAGARVLLSGGGARNTAIVRALQERLEGFRVETTGTMDLDPDAKEAVAFAVLGYETLRERTANLPGVTGASHASVLGAIAPYKLRAVLEKVATECRE
jgi:anhydro-N-acetylmuramic acid kinase